MLAKLHEAASIFIGAKKMERGLTALAAAFAASGLFVLGPTSASALTINDTFLSSVSNDPNAATIEADIHAASSALASFFSNSITVNILFGADPSLGGGASSTAAVGSEGYSTWTGLLSTNSSANSANTVLSTAVANLSHGNDANGLTPISVDTVNLRALGVSTDRYFNASGSFVGTGGQLYDGVVMITPTSFSISEIIHEIDEILGGGGQGSQLGRNNGTYGALDLYRYSGIGTPTFLTGSSTTAYFSVDGGATKIAGFNQAGGGSDYGDFTGPNNPSPSNYGPCNIQSAYVCSGALAFSTSSPEYAMLESIGYDPVTTPLPSTWFMFLSGLVGCGFFAYRGTKKTAAALAAA